MINMIKLVFVAILFISIGLASACDQLDGPDAVTVAPSPAGIVSVVITNVIEQFQETIGNGIQFVSTFFQTIFTSVTTMFTTSRKY